MAMKPSPDMLLQRIDQLAEEQDESSRRLHLDLDEVKRRVDAIVALHADVSSRLSRVESTPIEIDKIRLPPRIVAAIVVAVIATVCGMYASTYGLRSDVRDILTTMASQKELADRDRKDMDRQYETLTKAIDTIDKQQKLYAIEFQNLKETIIRQGVK